MNCASTQFTNKASFNLEKNSFSIQSAVNCGLPQKMACSGLSSAAKYHLMQIIACCELWSAADYRLLQIDICCKNMTKPGQPSLEAVLSGCLPNSLFFCPYIRINTAHCHYQLLIIRNITTTNKNMRRNININICFDTEIYTFESSNIYKLSYNIALL